MYNASEARYKRHKSDYNQVADDNGVPVKQEPPPSRRTRRRQDQSPNHSLSDLSDWDAPDTRGRFLPRPKQQVDAKALKPQILETTMPSTSLKEWFVLWDNYKEASGWGQDTNKTQLAYLRMVVSDKIRSAIQFDHLKTVHEAIHAMKQYLDKAVMPLTLRQLEVIRYKPGPGTSQTQAVQIMLQMF